MSPQSSAEYIVFTPVEVPGKCGSCVFPEGVVEAMNRAVVQLRAQYDDRPDGVSSDERGCWVRADDDTRLTQTDPRYKNLRDIYRGGLGLYGTIYQRCNGRTLQDLGGTSILRCGFKLQRRPDIPEIAQDKDTSAQQRAVPLA